MNPETINAFMAIASIIFLGFFGSMIFNKYRVPDVLLLILLGMLLGPDLLGTRLNLITESRLSDIDAFRDLFLSVALVVILFDGGLSLDMRSVIESMRLSTFMTVLTFVLEMAAIAAFAHFVMGLSALLALTLGAVLGGTSGAIVIPIANKLRIQAKTKSIMIMESAITDVLVVVAALSLLSVIKLGDFSVLGIAEELAIKFVLGAVLGLVSGVIWLFILERLRNQPLSYMITIAALFLVAGFVEMAHSSGAVAALAFGLMIGNRKFVKRKLTSVSLKDKPDEHILHLHTEITFFVRTFFFVYLGLIFRFDTFTAMHLAAGLALVGVIAFVRWCTTKALDKVGDLPPEDSLALFGLMPRGLAAAVLAMLPATALAGVAVWESEPDAADLFVNVTLIVILGTTILSTMLSFLVERRIDRARRTDLRKRLAAGELD
ncbi:MAG: cation:proton antiporter [Thermoplasmata archaeon]